MSNNNYNQTVLASIDANLKELNRLNGNGFFTGNIKIDNINNLSDYNSTMLDSINYQLQDSIRQAKKEKYKNSRIERIKQDNDDFEISDWAALVIIGVAAIAIGAIISI